MDENQKTPAAEPTPLRKLWDRFGYLIITAVTVILLFGVIFTLAYVPSGSMEPTLPTRSFFIASRLPYTLGDPEPDRGDIMVFYNAELNETLVKRVIGLPGETVSFDGGYVYIDGQKLEEDYLTVQGNTYPAREGDTFTVPEGCVFVMGDHRDDSLYSRFWDHPFVPMENLKGRALVDLSFLPGNTWLGIRLLG